MIPLDEERFHNTVDLLTVIQMEITQVTPLDRRIIMRVVGMLEIALVKLRVELIEMLLSLVLDRALFELDAVFIRWIDSIEVSL